MPKVLVLTEHVDPTLTLAGPNVNVIAAWYGVPRRPDRNIDMARRFRGDLERQGYVRLSPSPFALGVDPAVFHRKRLVVVFDGESEGAWQNMAVAFVGRAGCSVLIKVSVNAAVLGCVGKAAASAAAAAASIPMGVASAVLVAASAAHAAYAARSRVRSGDVAAAGDLTCAICLGEVTFLDDVAALHCGHCFHMGCVLGWVSERRGCPLCRGEALPLLEVGPDFAGPHAWARVAGPCAELAVRSSRPVEAVLSAFEAGETVQGAMEATSLLDASDAVDGASSLVHHLAGAAHYAELLLWV